MATFRMRRGLRKSDQSAKKPVAPRQVRRALPTTAQDDQLLLEQEILRHDCSHAPGTAQLRGHNGKV
jgi:hypothetical protein